MAKPMNYFIEDTDYYKRDLDVLGNANLQTAHYLHKRSGKPFDECLRFVEDKVKEGGEFDVTARELKVTVRKPNGDRVLSKMGIDRILNVVTEKGHILSPNLVVYDNPEINRSFIGAFINEEMPRRSKIKKMGFVAKQEGDNALATYCSNEEAGIKVGINSLSGMHLSPHNPLYNKTGHSTLTSTCRIITSYSNASTERMLAGNRHYWSPEVTRNNLITLSFYHDRDLIESVVKRYNLHIPSVDDVMEVIRRSTALYWFDPVEEDKLRVFVGTLDDIQRCAIAYIGDLYHLRKFNEDFVRKLLSELVRRPDPDIENPDFYVESASADTVALMGFLCVDFLRGKVADKLKEEDPKGYLIYAATIKHLGEVFEAHQDLINAFYITDNAPPSIYQLPSSLRRVVVGSDTDSTMFTTQEWVKWYFGKLRFDDDALRLSNVVGYINIQASAHWFAMASRHMGVEDKDLYRLEMKNEFYFPVYMRANRAKHYLTLISAREGNVYEEPEIEIKGVALKDSKNAPQVMNQLSEDATACMMDIMANKGVNIHDWEYRIAQIEHRIRRSINDGETTYLASSSIKQQEAYAEDDNSNYLQHVLWHDVFKAKYGDTEPLPYTVYKVSALTQNVSHHKQWLAKLPEDIRQGVEKFMEEYGKKYLGQYLVPKSAVGGRLPPEFLAALDVRRTVSELMAGYYIFLEMLGHYYNNAASSRLLSDEIPYDPEYKLWD